VQTTIGKEAKTTTTTAKCSKINTKRDDYNHGNEKANHCDSNHLIGALYIGQFVMLSFLIVLLAHLCRLSSVTAEISRSIEAFAREKKNRRDKNK
jgi:hypothetical protein